MRYALIMLSIMLGLMVGCRRSGTDAELVRDSATSSLPHHRLVWVQDTADNTDVFARGTNLQLMALDSRDGQGERVLVNGPANFNKPLITPDGQRVVFTDHPAMSMKAVNWDGSGLRILGEGKALAVWRDPANAMTWVYYGTKPVDANALAYHELHRFQLDDPAYRELVWDGGTFGEDNFQLSADGTIASGVFPWPECGLIHLSEKRFERLGKGCWTSLAPENTGLFWIFDGSHRNLSVIDLASRERWNINIGAQPGIDGHEAYHPRWSSHPRYLVATGPYSIRSGGNNIRGGGDNIEIFLGTFSKDFRAIESWTPLTRNQRGDFFPDLWVNETFDKAADTVIAKPRESEPLKAEIFKVQARLNQASSIPQPADIAPYREGLIANEYEITAIVEGVLSHPRILIAHWIIRDELLIEGAIRAEGTLYEMWITPFDQRPELEGARLSMDVDNVLLPMFYDINSGPAP